jgi:hypothetical protein
MEETKSILSQLRIDDQDLEGTIRLAPPPKVRKSTATEFIRVHPNLSYTVMALTNVPGGGFLFIAPKAAESIRDELRPVKIHACINREGELLFYPQVLAGKNGMSNTWSESLQQAMDVGKKQWVRIKAGNNCYDITVAKAELGDPDWTEVEKNMDELLEIAIKPCFIEHSDHVVLKKLRGEM